MEEFTEIGYTLKPHGLAGEIKIFVQEEWEDAAFDLDVVFLEMKGKKVPYFLSQIRGGGALIATFEEIDSRDDALVISSKPMFAKSASLPEPAPVVKTEIPQFVGYTMQDKDTSTLIGLITSIEEYPQQIMAVVKNGDTEYLVPLVEQYVVSQDDMLKVLVVDLPEGLLDL
jgi:16S rRNA processing protein RimM